MPALHVTLLHNPASGSEQHSREELLSAIENAGHRVVAQFSKSSELQASLPNRGRCDLVVVAGGDGTVGRAALSLVGSRLPMAILPLGTANNISRTLGIHGNLRHIISTWDDAAECAFDVGTLRTGNKTSHFAEAFGLGIFPKVIREADAQIEPSTPDASLERDLSLFLAAVHDTQTRMYRIDINGRDFSGRYLLVQVMNIPFLGPNLKLAPASDPCDGQLDVVLVGDADRHALDDLVSGARAWHEPSPSLPTHAATQVSISTDETTFQLDGDLGRCARNKRGSTQIDIGVLPNAVRIWMPQNRTSCE